MNNCKHCGIELKMLFTSFYCSNDCDKVPRLKRRLKYDPLTLEYTGEWIQRHDVTIKHIVEYEPMGLNDEMEYIRNQIYAAYQIPVSFKLFGEE